MGFKFSTVNRLCVVVCLVVLEGRMSAASPTSVSAFETGESEPRALRPPKLVSEEMQYEYEPNEGQKRENWIRNTPLGSANYETGRDQDVLEKECDVKTGQYSEIPPDRGDLNSFCNKHVRKSAKDVSSYSGDEEKCNSFLCAWYSEKCNEIMKKEHKFNSKDISTVKETDLDPALQKCKCFFRIWNQYGCDNILSARDKLDKETQRKDHYLNSRHRNEIRVLNDGAPVRSFEADGVGRANLKADEEGYQNDQAGSYNNRNARAGDDDPDSVVFFAEDDSPAPWERPKPKVKTDPFDRNSYTEEQRKCFAFKAVWYEGKCQELNSVKACSQSGQWLVLERPVTEADEELLKPVCKPKPCANDEVYWLSLKRCIKTNEAQKTCTGKGELVKSDAFGDGFCTCDDESGTFENRTDCYLYYQQGPCTREQVVTYNPVSGFAVCSPDLCTALNNPAQARGRRSAAPETKHHISKYGDTSPEKIVSERGQGTNVFKRDVYESSRRRQNKVDFDVGTKKIDPSIFEYGSETGGEALVRRARQTSNKRSRVTTRKPTATIVKKYYGPMDGTGTCYRLGSREPCERSGPDFYFKVDTSFHHPRCTEGNLELHLIDSPAGCKVDESNNCREEVKLAQTSELDFLLSLKKQARRKRAVKK